MIAAKGIRGAARAMPCLLVGSVMFAWHGLIAAVIIVRRLSGNDMGPAGGVSLGVKAKGVLVDNNTRSTMRLWGSWSRSVVW